MGLVLDTIQWAKCGKEFSLPPLMWWSLVWHCYTGVLYYEHLPLLLYSTGVLYYEHLSLVLYWCVYYAHLPLVLYSSVCSVFYEHTICCTMSALFPPCKLYGWNPSPPLYWYVVCIERLTLLLWKVEHLPPYFTSAERLPSSTSL